MAQCCGLTFETPDHHCPGCGAPQRGFECYPWYFCQDCLKLAEDGAGKRLEFANASLSGGLVWRRVGSEDWVDAITVIRRIKARPVAVHEARRRDDKHTTDLRRA